VLWTQPQDSEIFQSFRNDVPASRSLFAASPSPSPSPSASTASPTVSGAAPLVAPSASASSQGAGAAPISTPQPSITPSLPIPSARTANQNICAG